MHVSASLATKYLSAVNLERRPSAEALLVAFGGALYFFTAALDVFARA